MGLISFLPPLVSLGFLLLLFLESLETLAAELRTFPSPFLANCERGWSAILLPSWGEKLLLLSGGGRYPPGRAGGGVGEHAPQMLLYWLHEGSQLPVLTAFRHLGGHFGGAGVVLGTHWPQILLYVLQLWSQLPLLIASLHFDGHFGGGGVVLGTHCPQILLYELQLGSQLPV